MWAMCGVLSVPKLDLSIIHVHILPRDIGGAYIAYRTLLKYALGCVLHFSIVVMTSTIRILLHCPHSSGLPCWHWDNLMIAWCREYGSELSRTTTHLAREGVEWVSVIFESADGWLCHLLRYIEYRVILSRDISRAYRWLGAELR